jgi:hypothetical protein
MRRETVITYAATLPAFVLAMEACCGAHHVDALWRDKAIRYD